MIRLKPGVSLRGLRPEALLAVFAAERIMAGLVGKELTITSVCDGEHAERSFHHNGLAFDVHVKDLSQPTILGFVSILRADLGNEPKQYDVVHEDPQGPNEHVHIEFDDGHERAMTAAEGNVWRAAPMSADNATAPRLDEQRREMEPHV